MSIQNIRLETKYRKKSFFYYIIIMNQNQNFTLPRFMIPLFRTNHAGETGAVFIYKGILLVSRDKDIVDFSKKHLLTESKHLQLIESILDKKDRSKLTFLWKLAGFLTGLVPALLGKRFVYATIFYVESFVEKHYQDQIDLLYNNKKFKNLSIFIKNLQDDEVDHKDEALIKTDEIKFIHSLWGFVVSKGSALAVNLSKLI